MKSIIIIGGGLAGLVGANYMVEKGLSVTLVEKKRYPFHRVCGEYISNETIPFLKARGLFPQEFNPPKINRFQLTSLNGRVALLPLDLGGFGISRYSFDHFLYKKALDKGVNFVLDTEVESVLFKDESFFVRTGQTELSADLVIGSFGKRSRLDLSMKRSFVQKRSPYAGVKYHIRTDQPADLISLHNFKDGYCGISQIEDQKFTLCYLTHRINLKSHGSIKAMEEAVLFKNPYLKSIFRNSEFLFDKPEVINEISFATKTPIENHVLMTGDAAGMITPLCGNGMAMAIHSAKILSELVIEYSAGKITREHLEIQYSQKWNSLFAIRLWTGRQIQRLFGDEWTSNLAINLMRKSQPLAELIIKKTHGQPF
ncbi:MAG: FAD-dependent monooxygenase [Cyclobacteriaceae bacterium]|nr:FAD-dependent monooxygenase [Cyclobacteriaceae bacterium]